MKKLMLLVAACLVMVACNNKPADVPEQKNDSTEVTQEEHPCCQKMKEMMDKWANYDNLNEEEQVALINERAEMINNMFNEFNAEECPCPEAKEILPPFIEKWNKEFAAADNAGKKALIDEFDSLMPKKECCKKDGCCEKHEGEGCCEKHEGETCCKK